jgi:hypothetical protein
MIAMHGTEEAEVRMGQTVYIAGAGMLSYDDAVRIYNYLSCASQ